MSVAANENGRSPEEELYPACVSRLMTRLHRWPLTLLHRVTIHRELNEYFRATKAYNMAGYNWHTFTYSMYGDSGCPPSACNASMGFIDLSSLLDPTASQELTVSATTCTKCLLYVCWIQVQNLIRYPLPRQWNLYAVMQEHLRYSCIDKCVGLALRM